MSAKKAEPEGRDFMTVSLPRALLDRADRLVKDHPELGYTNKSGFIGEAVRRWLEREEERLLSLRSIYGEDAEKWQFPERAPKRR